MDSRVERDPYIAIMVAAATGRGVHLSAQEVIDLSLDDAIATRASNGLEAGEGENGWSVVDPSRPRTPANLGPRP